MARVVGWLLHRDNICEECNERPAVYIVEPDDYEYGYSSEMCNKCAPGAETDAIAAALKRAFE